MNPQNNWDVNFSLVWFLLVRSLFFMNFTYFLKITTRSSIHLEFQDIFIQYFSRELNSQYCLWNSRNRSSHDVDYIAAKYDQEVNMQSCRCVLNFTIFPENYNTSWLLKFSMTLIKIWTQAEHLDTVSSHISLGNPELHDVYLKTTEDSDSINSPVVVS